MSRRHCLRALSATYGVFSIFAYLRRWTVMNARLPTLCLLCCTHTLSIDLRLRLGRASTEKLCILIGTLCLCALYRKPTQTESPHSLLPYVCRIFHYSVWARSSLHPRAPIISCSGSRDSWYSIQLRGYKSREQRTTHILTRIGYSYERPEEQAR